MTNPLYDALFAPHVGSDRIFLHLPQEGRSLSYGQFLEMSAQFAHAFGALGLQPGDRIAVQVEKSPAALAIYAAAVQAGIIFLPLNTAYTAQEVAYFIEDSGARLVLCDPRAENALTPIVQAWGTRLMSMDTKGSGSFADFAQGHERYFAPVSRDADDLAAFLYTSGTTGRSKGAMLTQANLLSNAEVLKDYWRFTTEDVLLHALPIFHTHGLFVATNIMLLTGGAMIFLPKFDLEQMIAEMPKATAMMGVPTFYTRLLGDGRFDETLTKHMRLFVSGSAPLLADTHKEFEARTGHRILERYGMTETNMNTSNPYDWERRAGTVGHALPGVEVKITDPASGQTLPTGEIGQLEVRGPNVFKGYWNMPEKTREELREDGFFITGDLGKVDEDGYFTIVGRNKDLIITGGYNVYPKEVELVLDDQPGVLESAVIGVPHPDFGESPVGIVVALPGETPDLEAIGSALAGQLAKFKQPKRLIVLDALPRNTMGKVQKNVLRKQFSGVFAN